MISDFLSSPIIVLILSDHENITKTVISVKTTLDEGDMNRTEHYKKTP